MRILTIFVNSGGPCKTLDGRAILVLSGKELQVLVRLTRTAKVSAFESRERKRASGLMLGGGADTMGTAAWLRTIVSCEQVLPALCAACNKRHAWTRSLGFSGDVWLWNSKSRMGQKMRQKRE